MYLFLHSVTYLPLRKVLQIFFHFGLSVMQKCDQHCLSRAVDLKLFGLGIPSTLKNYGDLRELLFVWVISIHCHCN